MVCAWAVSAPPAPVLGLQPCLLGLPGVPEGLSPSQDVPLALCWVSFSPWFTSQHSSHSALMRTYGCWCLLPHFVGVAEASGAFSGSCPGVLQRHLFCSSAPGGWWEELPCDLRGSSCVSNASLRGPLWGHCGTCVRVVLRGRLWEHCGTNVSGSYLAL